MIVHAGDNFVSDHGCYFFAHHLAKLFLAFTLACREFIPQIICLLQHFNELSISNLIRTWVDQFITSHPRTFPFEPLSQPFGSFNFAFSWRELVLFACQNSGL
jgi:hypothetical protein